MKKILTPFLLAASLASPAWGQDDEIQETRAAMRANAPSCVADGKVTFKVYAPKASAVTVGGDWGGERTAMTRDEKGVWKATVQLRPQIFSYTFSIDGVRTLDPANTQFKPGRVVAASSIEVPGTPPMPWEMRNVPHGNVTTITYFSRAAGDQRRVTVYTPPGYQPDQAPKLPVLYLLHGNGETEHSWVEYGRANLVADSLLADGRMQPMIIVMPKGHAYRPGQTPEAGQSVTTAFKASVFKEDLLEEIIPLVEKTFRVRNDQPNRAIMGLSMGGAQSFSIGLGNLGLFSHVGLFSAGGGSSPEVLAKLTADPKATNEQLKLLWIGCGRLDRGFGGVEKLSAELTKAGVRHTFKPSAGGHVWPNWRDYLVETLPQLFR
jgi:enterochelin esterase family protein